MLKSEAKITQTSGTLFDFKASRLEELKKIQEIKDLKKQWAALVDFEREELNIMQGGSETHVLQQTRNAMRAIRSSEEQATVSP